MIHDDSQDFCEDSLRPMRTTQQVQFRCLSDEPGAAARSYGRSHDLCREKLFDYYSLQHGCMPSTAEPARRRKLGVDWVDDLAI